MNDPLNYPFDVAVLQRKKKALRRELSDRTGLIAKRIAVLGGSTTAEVVDLLELFLLKGGIRARFYQSSYNRFYEEIMFPDGALGDFAPDLIYLHTSSVNLDRYPSLHQKEDEVEALLTAEMLRFTSLWDRIESDFGCPVIQNNFELPRHRVLGNLDAYLPAGRTRFVSELNRAFGEEANRRGNLFLNDINYLAAWFGLERWHDRTLWYAGKYALSFDAMPHLAQSVASIAMAISGLNKKALVLDLDNTLWGGVIGDEGLSGIRIGQENPEAQAYAEFQQYLKELKERGILLAVSSKNDEGNAREGFSHPDSVLSLEDFSAFRANWEPKDQNVREIARSLGIGLDSLVFADDNPAERDLLRSQVPEVSVPEIGRDAAKYIEIIDRSGYFETVAVSADDLQRHRFYVGNALRQEWRSRFESHRDYLQSLQMVAEIKPFSTFYLERIAQLANKTNQFNLTGKRYTLAELQGIAGDDRYLTLYGRLSDRCGDNGLVSAIVAQRREDELHLDLWIMSCRVLKRGMEEAMFDRLAADAKHMGVTGIRGYYRPSGKNGLVSGLFAQLGFQQMAIDHEGIEQWRIDLLLPYAGKNPCIEVNP